MADKTDPIERLAELLLRQPLADWVRERRDSGEPWAAISRDLHIRTNGDVSLTGETLRVRYSAMTGRRVS
jgi:hypothetical protein